MDKTLIIRADANSRIGVGHVMRCLALGQAWRDNGGRVVFAMADGRDVFASRFAQEHFDVSDISVPIGNQEDAIETTQIAQRHSAQWIVVDGYQFNNKFQKKIKQTNFNLLCIDDYGHLDHFYADIILNQNLSAESSMYSDREANTRLMLGTRYALLRKEFLNCSQTTEKCASDSPKILVTLGGSDPDNVTLKVIQALQKIDIIEGEIRIIAGSMNPNIAVLQQAIEASPHNMRIMSSVENLSELLVWADIAITAGGSTCWEMLYMGVPNIIVVLAENQIGIARALDQHGVSINCGWHESLNFKDITHALSSLMNDKKLRKSMMQKGRKLIDGQGADRVLQALNNRKHR